MAGVSDRVFRALCRAHGADYAPSEMTSADITLRGTTKTQFRLVNAGETSPRIVQIAGAEPAEMAAAARINVDAGAEIIDINMGCPAKKVCNRLAGSALLKDEKLVAEILTAVVTAVDVPVTLKTRTGWDRDHRNVLTIARIAEAVGIQAIAIHGRTRACAYGGEVEYDTIAAVKAEVGIPVLANGDITTPQQAQAVFKLTGADGLLIGRAAQGDPWIFERIKHYLACGELLPAPDTVTLLRTLYQHVAALHEFYGPQLGVRIARKHAGWYCKRLSQGAIFRAAFNLLESAQAQLAYIDNHCYEEQGGLAA